MVLHPNQRQNRWYRWQVRQVERACRVCGPLNGTVVDGWFAEVVPPLHTFCGCRLVPLLVSELREALEPDQLLLPYWRDVDPPRRFDGSGGTQRIRAGLSER